MIVSHIILVFPYGLCASRRVVSGIGMMGGVPYTVALEEYTIRVHSNSDMICSKLTVAETLFA